MKHISNNQTVWTVVTIESDYAQQTTTAVVRGTFLDLSGALKLKEKLRAESLAEFPDEYAGSESTLHVEILSRSQKDYLFEIVIYKSKIQ